MLLFVRHGQSEANAAGLLIGRADSPLTALGRLQADAVGKSLAARLSRAPRVVTSPLQRAFKTVETIAAACAANTAAEISSGSGPEHGPTVEVDERFIELDYGEIDESPLFEVPAGLWDSWRADANWRPPGGETLEEVKTRVSAACEELVLGSADHDVIIVSHVSPIKAAVAWALGTPADVAWRLSLSVASITQIATANPSGPSLVSFNETNHLVAVGVPQPGPDATVPRVRRL